MTDSLCSGGWFNYTLQGDVQQSNLVYRNIISNAQHIGNENTLYADCDLYTNPQGRIPGSEFLNKSFPLVQCIVASLVAKRDNINSKNQQQQQQKAAATTAICSSTKCLM